MVNVYVPNSGTNQDYRKDVWEKVVYKFLSDRRRTEVGRLYGIENTTEKLKKVIEKVKKEGLF